MTAKICKVAAATATKAGRARTFRFRLSDGSPDRVHDRLAPQGWRLANFQRAPTVLWAHDASIPAIGKASNLAIEGQGARAALMGDVTFPPPGIHPLADQVHDLIGEGIIVSGSVGFIPIRCQPNELGGTDYLEQELTEFSIVNCGALPSALLVGRADAAAVTKWLRDESRSTTLVREPSPRLAITGDSSVPSHRLVRADDIVCRLIDDEPRYRIDPVMVCAAVQDVLVRAVCAAAELAIRRALLASGRVE